MNDCCGSLTDSVAPASAGAGQSGEARGFEIDWSDQTPGALASGVVSFDVDPIGRTVLTAATLSTTVLVAAGAPGDTLTIGPTGAVWDEGTTNTVWTSTTRSATSILATLAAVHALLDIDSTWSLKVETYFSAISLLNAEIFVTGFDGLSGTPANAGTRLSGAGRARQAATQVWRPAVQAGGVNYTTAPGPTSNVTAVVCCAQAMTAHAGTWPALATPEASWEALRYPVQWGVGKLQDAADSSPMLDQNTRILFFALATAGVAGTSSGTVERTRVTAFQSFGVAA